jgi:hypothetical protein
MRPAQLVSFVLGLTSVHGIPVKRDDTCSGTTNRTSLETAFGGGYCDGLTPLECNVFVRSLFVDLDI